MVVQAIKYKMQISLAIDKTYDNYDFSEIRCVEKPFSIILDSYMEGYGKMFSLALKYYQSYPIKNYLDQSTYEDIYRLQMKILNDYFGIDFITEEVGDSVIVDWIKNKVEDNCVPLIFGNLKELYYSKYYKKENWGHVFWLQDISIKISYISFLGSFNSYCCCETCFPGSGCSINKNVFLMLKKSQSSKIPNEIFLSDM